MLIPLSRFSKSLMISSLIKLCADVVVSHIPFFTQNKAAMRKLGGAEN